MKSIFSILNIIALKSCFVLIFVLALIDAAFFAMPVTTIFILMVTIKGINIGKCLLSAIAGTLAGALAGYGLGYFVLIKGEDWLTGIAQLIMDHNAGFSVSLYYKIRKLYQSWGFLVLLAGTFTPVPYGIFSISSGLLNINFFWFSILTLISHCIKYSFLAYFTIKADNKIRGIITLRRRQLAQIVSGNFLIAIACIRIL